MTQHSKLAYLKRNTSVTFDHVSCMLRSPLCFMITAYIVKGCYSLSHRKIYKVLLYTELEEMWWVHNTIVWSLKYETTFKMLQYNRLD